MTARPRKRRLKKKYRILFTIICCGLMLTAVFIIATSCNNNGNSGAGSAQPGGAEPSGGTSSQMSSQTAQSQASSAGGASSEPVGGSSGVSGSSKPSVSSAQTSSRPKPAVSSQKPPVVSKPNNASSSGGGVALTGIYKGIQWRSPTAKPCSFKYGRNLLLVNNDYELPEDFQWNLVYFSSGKPVTQQALQHWDDNDWNYTKVADAEAYGPLKQMFADAKAAGAPLNLVSSFRSIKLQNSLFNDYVVQNMKKGMSREQAIKAANTLRTYAGTSEHNTGLCFDIAEQGSSWLRVDFENTKQGKWLRENAPKYGFILRYPKEKQAITGISYEPWHFRYVGVEHAQKITQQGMCLEEYIDSLGGL